MTFKKIKKSYEKCSKKIKKVNCKFCKTKIETTDLRKIFCVAQCRINYHNSFKTTPKQKKNCPTCGTKFMQRRHHHVFCSRECQQTNYRRNNMKKLIENAKNWARKNREQYKEIQRETTKRQRKKYPEKIKARNIANLKIDITNKSCKWCGSKNKLQRHHSDYNKPLEVDILCSDCHKKIHEENLTWQKN